MRSRSIVNKELEIIMRAKLLATVATLGIAAFGIVGVAAAQETTNPQTQGKERVEKRGMGEGAQRKMNERSAQTGQADKREGETRANEAAQTEKREGETNAGKAAQTEKREGEAGKAAQTEKREGETNAGKAAQTEKREGETGKAAQTEKREGEAGKAAQTEKREGETNAGKAAQTEKREGETRANEAAQTEKHKGQTASERDVRVSGKLHISRENATRISEKLMDGARVENVNVAINIGAALPTTVELRPLPPEIVELAPEYQGYDYVVTNDEIVFVQPTTRDVVGTIALAGATAEEGSQTLAGSRPCPVD
jgi:hypothetical protein